MTLRRRRTKTIIETRPSPNLIKFKTYLERQKEILEESLILFEEECVDDIYSVGAMLRETQTMLKEITDREE